MSKNFLITTAIDYPSAKPHIGHLYEKICADAIARWHRLRGEKVHFSTGLDCHGAKIEAYAKKAKKTPAAFVKDIGKHFEVLCKNANISNDDYIRTVEERHKKVVNKIFKKIYDKGLIYKGSYEGLYCVDCETFYAERELDDFKCPIHEKKVQSVKEEGYFFKMGEYQEFLKRYIVEHPEFIFPEKKRNEMLNRLAVPLKDLFISRKNVKWGIPLAFDKDVTIFVWVEALTNYITTVDYPNKKFKEFWPGTHIIGPDIVFHHTVIWGSWLHAAGLPLPRVACHGFIVDESGRKMSKSLGNVVDPEELLKKYEIDTIRYYFMREVPYGEDGRFSYSAMEARHNNELANEIGNLLSRVSNLVEKKLSGKLSKAPVDKELFRDLDVKEIDDLVERYDLPAMLAVIYRFVQACNRYVNDTAPWKIEDEKELNRVLYNLYEGLRILAILLSPFIPESTEKMNKALGVKPGLLKDCKPGLMKTAKLKKGDILFKKIQ